MSGAVLWSEVFGNDTGPMLNHEYVITHEGTGRSFLVSGPEPEALALVEQYLTRLDRPATTSEPEETVEPEM